MCGGNKVISALELFNLEKISADAVEVVLNGMDVNGDRLIDLDDFLHVDAEMEDTSTSSNSQFPRNFLY